MAYKTFCDVCDRLIDGESCEKLVSKIEIKSVPIAVAVYKFDESRSDICTQCKIEVMRDIINTNNN